MLIRFGLVGGGFSAFYAIACALIINGTSLPPFAVNVSIFLICIPLAFYAQKRFAFRASTVRSNAFWVYAATQIGSLAVVSAVTTRLITYDLIKDTLIMGATVVVTALLSFLIGRFLTFRPRA